MAYNWEIAAIKPPQSVKDAAALISSPLAPVIAALNTAVIVLEAIKIFLLAVQSPLTNVIIQLIDQLKKAIEDFKNSGLYVLYIDPLPAFDLAKNEMLENIDVVRNLLKKEGAPTLQEVIDATDPQSFYIPGGIARMSSTIRNALLDADDDRRPNISDTGVLGGYVVVVNADIKAATDLVIAIIKIVLLFPLGLKLSINAPPKEITIKSVGAKATLTWKDEALISAPEYRVFIASQKGGVPVTEAVTPVDKMPPQKTFVLDEDGNIKKEYINKIFVDGSLFTQTFEFIDIIPKEETRYYAIAKVWGDKIGPLSVWKRAKWQPSVILESNIGIFENEIFYFTDPLEGEDPVPQFGGRIKIDDEIIAYAKVEVGGAEGETAAFIVNEERQASTILQVESASVNALPGVLLKKRDRGVAGTLAAKHKAGAVIEILPDPGSTQAAQEPNFYAIKMSDFFGVDQIFDPAISYLDAFVKGLSNASDTLIESIDNLKKKIKALNALIKEIDDAISRLFNIFDIANLSVLVLPVEQGSTFQFSNRISSAFNDPTAPVSGPDYVAGGICLFVAGPIDPAAASTSFETLGLLFG